MSPKTVINASLILMAINAVLFFSSIIFGFADIETLAANIFIGIAICAIISLNELAEFKDKEI